MKRALKKKSNIYAYLDSTKVLEVGTNEAITKAKHEYWKAYKAQWRKNQRKTTAQFTIVFTANESNQILIAAKKHKRSQSAFIKQACLSYVNQRFLVPDMYVFGEMRQILSMNYRALQKLFDESIIPYQTGKLLIEQMITLERTVLQQLRNPKTLEKWIEETVRNTPQYKEELFQLLQNIQV